MTGLPVLVWYFPLWHMGISGYEVAIVACVSPLFFAIPSLRHLAVKNLRLLHLLSLSGLLAYKFQNPANRLFVTSFALSTTCAAWVAGFFAERANAPRLETRIMAWGMGLIMSSVAKFACSTNNPLWPIMHADNGGWNKIGLFIAIFAVLRSQRGTATSGGDYLPAGGKKGSPYLAAAGFGGLMFAIVSLLTDSSTMISWVWDGYPVRGPIAVPHGAVTIFFMGAGLVYGTFHPAVAGSWTAFGIGSIGATLLTYYHHWTGYYGALAFAFYVMSVSPVLISSCVRHSPATTFGLGFILYVFLLLFHVWVVAYAFVPGGPLVREHTDWVMLTTMLSIGAGVFSAATSNSGRPKKKPVSPNSKRQRSYYIYVLAALQLLAVAVAYLRFPTNDYQPHHKEDKVVTAGIWTVHFGLDNNMWAAERRMRNVLGELELDVIGFLESDNQRIIMGNKDVTQFIAEDLGYYVDFGPGPNKHTWGSALLSKFPIVSSTHHLLPSPVGELAPAIHATLDMYGELVDVVVFHSGQEEDPEDRRLQTEYLSKLMGASPRPLILLSYLVTKPLEGNYNTYVSELSGMKDIDATDWDRWCEYVLYKNIKRIGYARVSRDTITDTEIQVSPFSPSLGSTSTNRQIRLENSSSASLSPSRRCVFRRRWSLSAVASQPCSAAMVCADIVIMCLTSLGTGNRPDPSHKYADCYNIWLFETDFVILSCGEIMWTGKSRSSNVLIAECLQINCFVRFNHGSFLCAFFSSLALDSTDAALVCFYFVWCRCKASLVYTPSSPDEQPTIRLRLLLDSFNSSACFSIDWIYIPHFFCHLAF